MPEHKILDLNQYFCWQAMIVVEVVQFISHFDISNAHASTSILLDQNKTVFHSQICDKSVKINMF